MDIDEDITTDDTDIDETEEREDRTPRGLRKELERRRAAEQAAKAEAQQLKRDLAIARAGVDVNSPIGELFARTYDGEMTPEAVKAAYAKLQPATQATAPATAEDEDEVVPSEEERTAERRHKTLANGTTIYGMADTNALGRAMTARLESGQRDVGMKEWLNANFGR